MYKHLQQERQKGVMMKKLIIALVLINTVSFIWSQDEFSWGLFLSAEGTELPDSFSRPIIMKDDNIFTILVKSDSTCYCYLVGQDSGRNVVILYNGKLEKDTELKIGPVQLNAPAGTENFYVVTSKNQQLKLEKSVEKYLKNNSSKKKADDVITEIFNLRRSVSSLNENPEIPVLLGGAFRNTESDIKGTNYSGADTYVKSIVIRH
jgi:hypothetical protein